MAAQSRRQRKKITTPELEQFVIDKVRLTGVRLGKGSYGSVEEAEILHGDNRVMLRVAAKSLHSELVQMDTPQQDQLWVNNFVEECKLMSRLRHPHIVQFLGVCYLPGSPLPVLLMEKLQTSLDNLLETSPNIPLDSKVYFLMGISRGIVYLHSHSPSIVHRDLTARNILIDSGLTAKIVDLGVARMVNIQPGDFAATMTAGPGNALYMPPEAGVQDVGTIRYNTAIDIFSFGVVSLFTLTQTFPKTLQPANYIDEKTKELKARNEIERRDRYVLQMKAALGETSALVKLTLDCLNFKPEDRPPAVEVLKRLEEIEVIVSQNHTTHTKLELIQHISDLALRINDELQQMQEEHQKQLSEKNAEIYQLQLQLTEKNAQIDCLQAEKQAKVKELEKLSALHQQHLDIHCEENGQLSKSQELQEDVPVTSSKEEIDLHEKHRGKQSWRKLSQRFFDKKSTATSDNDLFADDNETKPKEKRKLLKSEIGAPTNIRSLFHARDDPLTRSLKISPQFDPEDLTNEQFKDECTATFINDKPGNIQEDNHQLKETIPLRQIYPPESSGRSSPPKQHKIKTSSSKLRTPPPPPEQKSSPHMISRSCPSKSSVRINVPPPPPRRLPSPNVSPSPTSHESDDQAPPL